MKQIRWIFLFLGLFFFACADLEEGQFETSCETDVQNHAVSVDDALKELNAFLNVFEKETRTSGQRVVGNIEPILNPELISSRSQGGVDTLLYIANFEDSLGYAVLGADDRLGGVIAIIDKGNLSSDEFLTSLSEESVKPSSIFNQLLGYAQNAVVTDNNAKSTRTFPGFWNYEVSTDIKLTTKWHQRDPYNFYCPEKNGQKCVAGCVAVAVAQIVAYNKLVNGVGPNVLRGYDLDWNGIFEDMKNGTNPLASAKLIRAVGKAVNMDYGLSSSSSTVTQAMSAFFEVGYNDLGTFPWRYTRAEQMIRIRGLPTYARGRGKSIDGKTEGHAWVVDGYARLHRFVFSGDNQFDYSVPHEIVGEEYKRIVHCNFGWTDGWCNGYYISGVFDLTQPADIPDYWGQRLGDVYSWSDLQIVQYYVD